MIEYVTGLLGAGSVQLHLAGWKKERRKTSWVGSAAENEMSNRDFLVNGRAETQGRVFRFTRAVATDQRLRFEGAIAADKMARELFTAEGWDWTPEDIDRVDKDLESRHLSMPLRRK